MKLYQREDCSASIKVRRFLTEHNLSFEAISVPKLSSERSELLELPGLTSPMVPVLVDGDEVIQESDAIIEYLTAKIVADPFGDPGYGITRVLAGVNYADAVPAVKEALATEGFGILSEIDVKATLKKKLDVDHPNYVILGACNPPLAHRALSAIPAIGLLLPCNVVVTERPDGSAVVSAIDPARQFEVVRSDDLGELAAEVGQKLQRAIAAIAV